MPAPNAYSRGIDEKVFAQLEGSFRETFTSLPAATDAMRHLMPVTMTPGEPKEARDDSRNTRALLEEVVQKIPPGPWSLRKYVLPGGAGVDPDDFAFWQAGFGTKTGQTFTMKDKITDSVRLSIFGGLEARIGMGCVVQRIVVDAPDTKSPTVEFSGLVARVVQPGTGLVLSGTVSAATFIAVSTHGRRLEEGAIIIVDDGTNEDSYRVTAVAGDTVTVTPVLARTYAGGDDAFYPEEPASLTTGGVQISAAQNSVTIDGVGTDIELVSARFELGNDHKMRDQERGQKYATGFGSGGNRSLQLSMRLYHKAVLTALLQDARAKTTRDVIITLGATAGQRLVLAVPAWSPRIPPGGSGEQQDQTREFAGIGIGAAEASADFT